MDWIDYESYIEIYPPKEFNFDECLIFLGRSNQELLHQIKEKSVFKLIKVNELMILSKVEYINNIIEVKFLLDTPYASARRKVAEYIWEWFDLGQDLESFYLMAGQDGILNTLVDKYYGLRMMCIPDLFEALVWAIMGQQINLTFAYTLKRRFVQRYGESLTFEGETYWLFPSFEKIVSINVDDLRKQQFTVRKAEYIIGIANAMNNGELTKKLLFELKEYQQMKKSLMMIRGIGAWTADYVMMKNLHCTSSFPVADIGLQNALKKLIGLERKPTMEEMEEYAVEWEGWQAYAVFYLWRSLYDKNI